MHFDEQGDSYLDSARVRERVMYTGTMDALEQCLAMHLTNPATHEAYVIVTVTCRDADAPLTATPVIAELCSVKLVCSTGLKIADVVDWMRHGKSIGRNIYEEGHDKALGGEKWVFDNVLQEHRKVPSPPPVPLRDLEECVQELRGWGHVVCDPTFKLDITLWASASRGLLPIVPMAEELRRVIKR